jgi:RND family efflux transporter MFP subunit
MSTTNKTRAWVLTLAVLGCGATAALAADRSTEPLIAPAISVPSKELKLSFGGPGLVKDVPVKEGDRVKAGQVLAVQDDRQDEAAYESAKKEAESTAKIDYSTADRDQKQVKYQRLAVTLAETQIDLAKLEHEQKILDARRLEVKVEQMKICAPVDGIVQKINLGEGEMADPQNRDGAVVVVTNDPLWVEMHIPTAQAQQLSLGDKMQVRTVGDKDWQDAKIIYFAPKADAASDTETVRLEVPNPNSQRSGLQMQVKLPDKLAAVAENGAAGTGTNP